MATWCATAVAGLGVQVAFNAAYAAVAVGDALAAFPASDDVRWVWIALWLFPPLALPALALPAKRHDRKYFKHAMQLLRLSFDTKLGQFSPV